MIEKTIKTWREVQLEKKYFLPIHAESGYIAWQLMSKLQRKKFGRAYVRFHDIKTTKELASGPHRFTGLLNALVKDGSIAYVFERKRKDQLILDEERITVYYKNDGKVDWRRMKKKRAVRYIRAYCREHNIQTAFELAHGSHKDTGMYQQILKAGWSDDIFPPPPPREELVNGHIHRLPLSHNNKVNWDKVSKAKFRRYFRDVCAENDVKQRADLRNNNAHLLQIAKKRGLLDELLPLTTTDRKWHGQSLRLPTKGKRIMWSELTDAEAEAAAEAYFLEHDITLAEDLISGQYQCKGLYKDLNQRGLLPKLFGHTDMIFETLAGQLFTFRRLSNGKKSWHEIDNQTVEKYIRAFMLQHGLTTQAALTKKSGALLQLIARRGVLKNIFPETEEIVEYCGRRFRLPKRGRYVEWHKMNRDILNIYVAARCRHTGERLVDFTDSLVKKIDRKKVKFYRKHGLPNFTAELRRVLREACNTIFDFELPDEILWAYGFEKYEIPRIRTRGVRKIISATAPELTLESA